MYIFLIFIVLVGYILEQISLNNHIDRITYTCTPNVNKCEIGEVFDVKTIISNRSNKFLTHIRLEEHFPYELEIIDVEKNSTFRTKTSLHYNYGFFIRRKERVTRIIKTKINCRGEFNFSGCKLFVDDFLGFLQPNLEIKQNEKITVYPKQIDNIDFKNALSNFYGDIISKRTYIDDPILILGYRDYTNRDPFKNISWKQSAKRNSLMVKEFDYTQEYTVDIMLDLNYMGDFENTNKNQELCFSIIRTTCEFLSSKKVAYTLISNLYINGEDNNIKYIKSMDINGSNLDNILVILSRASKAAVCSTEDLISNYLKTSTITGYQQKSLIYVATSACENNTSYINVLRKKYGINVFTFYGEDFEEVEKA